MKTKQIFSLVLAVMMIISVAASVFAGSFSDGIIVDYDVSSFSEDSFMYIMLSDGTCAITGYAGPNEVITIPETVEGIPVTAMIHVYDSRYLLCNEVNVGPHVKLIIGTNSFDRINDHFRVLNIIADGLEISDYAFYNTKSLQKLTIKGSVNSIGKYAFANCKNLKEVTLPEGITTIPEGMFYRCTSLERIVLPSTVEKIDKYAFSGCSSLESIVLPSSLKKIDEFAFSGCSFLKSATIPEGATDIASNAFEGTPIHGSIKPESSDGLFYEGYLLKSVDKSKIKGKVVIKDGTMSIANGVFKDCTELTEIVLPKDFNYIGAEAFENCINLKKVTGRVRNVGKRAFACSGITEISVGGDVGDEAFRDCTSLTKVEIRGGDYGKYVFAGCAVEYVYFPGTMYKVPEGMFAGCTNLKEILIGHGVSMIEERAFDCDGYTDIILPETLSFIKDNAITSKDLKNVYYAIKESQLTYMLSNSKNNTVENATIHANTKNIFYQFWDMPALTDWWYQGFKHCLLNGIMNGTAEHYFSPDVITTRAQLVTTLWRLDGSPEVPDNGKFTDITADWYASAVYWASSNGIVMGTSETTFSPDREITRQEAATLFYRYAEYKNYDTNARTELTSFPDHGNVMSFAYDALSWANAEGLITGVSNYGSVILDPAGSATRAQIATILMRYSETFH